MTDKIVSISERNGVYIIVHYCPVKMGKSVFEMIEL